MSGFGFWPCCDPCRNCPVHKTWRFGVATVEDNMPTFGQDCTDFNGTYDVTLESAVTEFTTCAGFISLPGMSGNNIVVTFWKVNDQIESAIIRFGLNLTETQGEGIEFATYTGGNFECNATSFPVGGGPSGSTECAGWPVSFVVFAVI